MTEKEDGNEQDENYFISMLNKLIYQFINILVYVLIHPSNIPYNFYFIVI